jgi:hypothetical protein
MDNKGAKMREEIEKELEKIEEAADELGDYISEFCERLWPKCLEIDDSLARIRALLRSKSE